MNSIQKGLICILLVLSLTNPVSAQRFGKLDNLYEYLLKGQFEKFDKSRIGVKPKDIEPFSKEYAYVDELRQLLYTADSKNYESYFQSFTDIMKTPVKTNMDLLTMSLKVNVDTLKNMGERTVFNKLKNATTTVVDGKFVLKTIQSTKYPATQQYIQSITDMVFNAQYADLLGNSSLDNFRAFITDWPKSAVISTVKKNYDDSLFVISNRIQNHDLYLLDTILPNETKLHLIPDDWSILGDKYIGKEDLKMAVKMYQKAIQLGSKEGLLKLTILKYEGKVPSEEDELIIFKKLAEAGDKRAEAYVQKIEQRSIRLAVPGTLIQSLNIKDQKRVCSITLQGPVNQMDLALLKEMSTKYQLSDLNLAQCELAKIPDEAFKGSTKLASLLLPNQLVYIGSESFADCSSLKALVLPDSLTQLMANAFDRCVAMKSIKIPASLTSGLGIVPFCTGCVSLTEYLIDERNPVFSSVDGVIFDKFKATLIRYPSGKNASSYVVPSTVSEIATGAFESSVKLTSVQLPDTLKRIKYAAFKKCTALSTITIPTLVNEIGASVFEQCENLSAVQLPMFLSELNQNTFKNCMTLSSVMLPESIKEIRSECFSGCENLLTISLNNNIKGLGEHCFKNCKKLKEVKLSIQNPLNVSSIFDGVDKTNCTLFVPLGSKVYYQQFPIWKDFQNIIEY